MPNAGQNLAQTRDQIRNNIGDLKASLAVNHVDLDLAPNTGKHKFIQMPSTGSPGTAPATATDELGLYVKGAGASTRLWIRQQNNGTEVQLSGIDPLNADPGYTFLPGGLLLQFGQKTSPGTSGTITFPISFSAAPYSINLTLYRTNPLNSQIVVDSGTVITAANFHYKVAITGASGFFWMAIGPKS